MAALNQAQREALQKRVDHARGTIVLAKLMHIERDELETALRGGWISTRVRSLILRFLGLGLEQKQEQEHEHCLG